MTYQERIDTKTAEIEALTAYANGVTGQADTSIGDAVKTLCDGYGSGSEKRTFVVTETVSFQGLIHYDKAVEVKKISEKSHTLSYLPGTFAQNAPLPLIEELTLELSGLTNNLSDTFRTNYYYVPLRKIKILGDTSQVSNWTRTFQNNASSFPQNLFIDIEGTPIDFSGATNSFNATFSNFPVRKICVKPNTIPLSISFNKAAFDAESAVSVANGLDGSKTGLTITLPTTVKTMLETLLGEIGADGLFYLIDSGSLTLENFIKIDKGWNIS